MKSKVTIALALLALLAGSAIVKKAGEGFKAFQQSQVQAFEQAVNGK